MSQIKYWALFTLLNLLVSCSRQEDTSDTMAWGCSGANCQENVLRSIETAVARIWNTGGASGGQRSFVGREYYINGEDFRCQYKQNPSGKWFSYNHGGSFGANETYDFSVTSVNIHASTIIVTFVGSVAYADSKGVYASAGDHRVTMTFTQGSVIGNTQFESIGGYNNVAYYPAPGLWGDYIAYDYHRTPFLDDKRCFNIGTQDFSKIMIKRASNVPEELKVRFNEVLRKAVYETFGM